MAPALNGIDVVVLFVADLERAKAFYVWEIAQPVVKSPEEVQP